MPIHHLSVCVPESKIEGVVSFLLGSLEHMGFREHLRPVPRAIGLGEEVPYLWIIGVSYDGMPTEVMDRQLREMHVAFASNSIQQVKQFHAAGLKAGGIDNGHPGHRPEYHKGYYGAFVRDPVCGINFEVVFSGCPDDAELVKMMEENTDARAE